MAGNRWIERAALIGVGATLGWILGRASENTEPARSASPGDPVDRRMIEATEPGGATRSISAPADQAGAQAARDPGQDPPSARRADTLANLARPTLRTADESRRTMAFNQLIESMSAEDAPAIAQIFTDLRREGLEFHPEGDFFAQRWGELDPKAAIAHIEQHGDFGRSDNSMVAVFTGWAMTVPAQALEWIVGHPDHSDRPAALKGLAQGWARSDPQGAADMVFNVLQGREQEEAAEMVAWQVLYGQGMGAATEWFDRLPTDPESAAARQRAFGVLKSRQLMRGNEEAEAWVAEREPEQG